tara:strand:- start:879 stop:1109 length:231 start_codon:yes stop_codon:yes gene_type:complete
MEVERLDVKNILEIQKIRDILKPEPELLSIFELLCKSCSIKINKDSCKVVKGEIVIEDNTEPLLSSDSEDYLDIEE